MACQSITSVQLWSSPSSLLCQTAKRPTLPNSAAFLPTAGCPCLRRRLDRVRVKPVSLRPVNPKRRGINPVKAEAVSTDTKDKIREVGNDSFQAVLEEAGDRLVVLDMYTQWCGPCKLMYPKLVEAAEKYDKAVFIKLDCNQENKPLAKSLGIKAVPTFKLFKNKEQVHEIQGAKYDALIEAIEKHL